jgi:hypothetical protein
MSIAKDLSMHLRERLQRVVEDELDTARIAQINSEGRYAIALSQLLILAASMAIELGGERDDFLDACGESYDNCQAAKRRWDNRR